MLNNPARPFTNVANCVILGAFFYCSNYIFHKNSTEGRNWETKTLCCQNSSECDRVSIKEEEEWNFVKKYC